MVLLLAIGSSPARAAEPTYWHDVRPVLRKHCTVCHSARHLDETDVSGGLALDTYAAVRKGAKEPVVQPGSAGASLLIHRLVTKNEDQRMPQGAEPLSSENISLLRRWIDAGAPEGMKPIGSPIPVETGHRVHVHRLPITLPTEAVPPKGWDGTGGRAKLRLRLPVGPLAPVAAVTFSPDGKQLAAGSYGQVTIWDLAAVRPVKVLTNVLGAVNDLRFSPDGRLLAVAGGQPSARGDLRLYDTADWKLLGTLPGHADVVFSVAFSPDGRHLASASFDKMVRIWDLATRKPERTLTGHTDFVYSVAYSPDGRWLVSASKDRTVKLVEAATGRSRFTFSGMNQDVLAVAVRPDGKQVVSSGFEPALVWWNPQTGQRVRAQGGHGGAVHELCFSKDGRVLASAGADRTVRLWNGQGGAPLRTIPVGSVVYAVGLSPDGRRVASGSFDGLVRLWDVATGRRLVTLLAPPVSGGAVEWLALTPEGYVAGSQGLLSQGRWDMAGRSVADTRVWSALDQPARVAQAARGEKLTGPTFDKR